MAPFTVTPMPGSITAIVSTNDATSSIGVTALITFSPCRAAAYITASPSSPNIT